MAALTIAPAGMGVRALGAPSASRAARRGGASTARALGFAGEGMGQRASLRRSTRADVRLARGRGQAVVTKAVTGPLETRLGSILTSLPQRIDLYFRVRRGRKLLWKAIFAFTGFYTANVLSLTFGVLARGLRSRVLCPSPAQGWRGRGRRGAVGVSMAWESVTYLESGNEFLYTVVLQLYTAEHAT